MGLTNENGNFTMPVTPMGYGGGGFGNSFGGDGGWWLLLLLFALGGGWGNGWGFGGGNGSVGADVQRGFDQSAVMSGINNLSTAVGNGFSAAEVAECNRAMNAMQTAFTNQIASMNQSFANAQNLDSRLFAMQTAQQTCCCDTKAGIADLKYTVATEACADRNAITSALRDVLEANNASTQRILDQMCNDKIDAKNEKIADLERQLTMANFAASQGAQTAAILANNEAQTTALEQYLAPVPKPAYIVQNPACCNQNFGCGCGYNVA